jgi:CheY-like chemotaxis protein
MDTRGFSAPILARHELEESWRLRLEESQQKYQKATETYRSLLRLEQNGRYPDPDSALARARQAESEALMEYSRVLRIFTDLTIHGKMPEQQTFTTFSEGVLGPAESIISIVDDDESIRDSTKRLLRSAGYKVSTYASAETFLGSGDLRATNCIVLDVRMPGMDGLELQRKLNETKAGVPIVFLTAHDDSRSRRMAMDGGAVDFLCKPFEANSLVSAVETALTRQSVKRPSD